MIGVLVGLALGQGLLRHDSPGLLYEMASSSKRRPNFESALHTIETTGKLIEEGRYREAKALALTLNHDDWQTDSRIGREIASDCDFLTGNLPGALKLVADSWPLRSTYPTSASRVALIATMLKEPLPGLKPYLDLRLKQVGAPGMGDRPIWRDLERGALMVRIGEGGLRPVTLKLVAKLRQRFPGDKVVAGFLSKELSR